MDKEALRKLYGQEGDYSPKMEKLFGSAYADFGDDSRSIPDQLKSLEDETGLLVHRVNSVIGRSLEMAPEVDCRGNQRLLACHLKAYFEKGEGIAPEQFFSVSKHMMGCCEPECRDFYEMACLDMSYPPGILEKRFGKRVADWLEDDQKTENCE